MDGAQPNPTHMGAQVMCTWQLMAARCLLCQQRVPLCNTNVCQHITPYCMATELQPPGPTQRVVLDRVVSISTSAAPC